MLKKALLVGINTYPGAPLRGCLNDVDQMHQLLTSQFGFSAENVRMLRDAEATTQGIVQGLTWLAEGDSDPAAVRVFHYSGHGTLTPDQNGDEPDGSDECIVPYDYPAAGFMTDDTLATLYDRFPRTSNLTLVMDCCHSGTIQRLDDPQNPGEDIVYRFLPVSYQDYIAMDQARAKYEAERKQYLERSLERFRNLSPEEQEHEKSLLALRFDRKRGRFGDVTNRESNILLAAARSDQTAADARIAGGYHGAFTWYLVNALSSTGGTPTYAQVVAALAEPLYTAGYTQVPQLESQPANRDRPIFAPFST
ncbi:MAG: caspase family protein [Ardenticatenaceae bacterium]|nr:caspase family protein [Ardenticatenaceae bacterium]HBY93424.1 hypothetical protein [Chloroflexota bacterium]